MRDPDAPKTGMLESAAARPSAGAWLLAADFFSAFGSWIDFLAILTLAAYQFKVGSGQMAVLSIALLLPGILAARHIGRACDRGQALPCLQISLLARAAISLALLACGNFEVFLCLIALRSVMGAITQPAVQVLAVHAVPIAQRSRYYAQLNMVASTAKILAPLGGALISRVWGEGWALGVSALFAGCALLGLWPLRRVASQSADPAADEAMKSAVSDGAALQASGAPPSTLLPLLWLACAFAAGVFLVNNLMPLILARAGLDKSLLGLWATASGLGNLLAGVGLARQAGPVSASRLGRHCMAAGLAQMVVFGCMGAAFGWLGSGLAVLLLVLAFGSGMCGASFFIQLNRFMAAAHAQAMGQASSALQAAQSSVMLVAPLVGAFMLDAWGTPALFATAAGLGALGLLLWPLAPSVKARAASGFFAHRARP